MGADNSSLSRLCGASEVPEDETQINTEISQTENYQQVSDNEDDSNDEDEYESDESDQKYDDDNDDDNDDDEQYAKMERELKEAKDAVGKAQWLNTECNRRLEEIKKKYAQLKDQFEDEKREKSSLAEKIKEYEQQINRYKEQKAGEDDIQLKIDKYKVKITGLEEEISEQKEENTELQNEISTLQETLDEKTDMNNEIETLQNKINAKVNDISNLESEITQLKKQQLLKDEMIERLNLKLETAQKMDVLDTYAQESYKQFEDMVVKLKADNKQLQKRNEILQNTQNEHDKCENIIQQLKDENNELQQQNQTFEQSQNEKPQCDHENIITQLKANNTDLKQQNKTLEEKMNSIENEKNVMYKSMIDEKENASKLKHEVKKYQDTDDNIYSVEFTAKPFGLTFGSTKDKKNLMVNKIVENSIAYKENVIKKSIIIKLQNESVENLGAKKTFKIFSTKFKDTLPLKMTFRKPNEKEKLSVAQAEGTNYNSDDNIVYNKNKQSQGQLQTHLKPKYASDYTESDDNKSDAYVELDEKYDVTTEVTHVYSWLKIDANNKQSVKQLKDQLVSLLTNRSIKYKQKLNAMYLDEYGNTLVKDIRTIIGNKMNNNGMDVVSGLLMTSAEFDAILFFECIRNTDFEPIADIICCRSMVELKEIRKAYKNKSKNKLDIKQQLKALAQNDKKNTLVKVIEGIFDGKREEEGNMSAINADLDFILNTKKFKDDTKEKLALIFTANSVKYIKILNEQFRLKSKDSLITFIDKKLGSKSTVGYFCKVRISYASDSIDYYAQKIKKLGSQYKKNQKKIAIIFVQRFEIDLSQIKKIWTMKKYGDGKNLKNWVIQKTSISNDCSLYLQKMLDNCDRYA